MHTKLKLLSNIKTLEGHNGAIYDIIYANGFLYTSSADHYVVRWNPVTGDQTDFVIKLKRSAYNIAYGSQDELLAIGENNGEIHVIDVAQQKEIRLLAQHRSSIFSLTYNSHKNQFYSGDRAGYFAAWDGENFDFLKSLSFECDKIREIAINETGDYIAICPRDGILRIINTADFSVEKEFQVSENGIDCGLFDGDKIYIGGKNAFISIWNWKTGKRIHNIAAHNFVVYDLEFIDHGQKLVSASFDKSIKLWDVEDMTKLETVEYAQGGHKSVVNRIAKISEDTFATVSDDRKIKIWKLHTRSIFLQ